MALSQIPASRGSNVSEGCSCYGVSWTGYHEGSCLHPTLSAQFHHTNGDPSSSGKRPLSLPHIVSVPVLARVTLVGSRAPLGPCGLLGGHPGRPLLLRFPALLRLSWIPQAVAPAPLRAAAPSLGCPSMGQLAGPPAEHPRANPYSAASAMEPGLTCRGTEAETPLRTD